MSDSHKVTWERLTVDLPSSDAWRHIEPSGTTELTCTCGWTRLVPDAEAQQAIDDHSANPTQDHRSER